MESVLEASSTRPYLLRAIYEWCSDNGLTPYVAVMVDDSVQVPREYVNNGEIVLNVSFDATSGLKLGNDFIEFKARFGGVPRDIMVPVERVAAIYARENGQGMAFPVPGVGESRIGTAPAGESGTTAAVPSQPASPKAGPQLVPVAEGPSPDPSGDEPSPPPKGPRPALKRVK